MCRWATLSICERNHCLDLLSNGACFKIILNYLVSLCFHQQVQCIISQTCVVLLLLTLEVLWWYEGLWISIGLLTHIVSVIALLIASYLDRAALLDNSTIVPTSKSKWKVCTITQVEETKAIVKLMPIWAGTIVMNVVLAQLQTFTIEQGSTMNRKIRSFKFPPASIPFFPLIIMAILVPVYDRLFVPFARRYTGLDRGITFLQRIGIGLVLSIVSMIIAAVVEVKRTNIAKAHGLLDAPLATIPLSIFWLVPQYFTFGIADMFTYIGVLEFFYDQAPDSMRSTSTGLSFTTISLGYFISTAVVKIVNRVTRHGSHPGWLSDNIPFNRNKLNLFYWLMAVLSFVNFLYFVAVAYFYRYKKYPHEKTFAMTDQLQIRSVAPVDSTKLHAAEMEEKEKHDHLRFWTWAGFLCILMELRYGEISCFSLACINACTVPLVWYAHLKLSKNLYTMYDKLH